MEKAKIIVQSLSSTESVDALDNKLSELKYYKEHIINFWRKGSIEVSNLLQIQNLSNSEDLVRVMMLMKNYIILM